MGEVSLLMLLILKSSVAAFVSCKRVAAHLDKTMLSVVLNKVLSKAKGDKGTKPVKCPRHTLGACSNEPRRYAIDKKKSV
jgi:hypothetical protein